MNRRDFIYASFVVATIPVVFKAYKYFDGNPLTNPTELKKFCNHETIFSIGLSFLNQYKEENNRNQLIISLKTDQHGVFYEGNNRETIAKIIDNKIKSDFGLKNICTIEGWIISRTEARQCGLLTII